MDARSILNGEAKRLTALMKANGVAAESSQPVESLSDREVCGLIMWAENDLQAYGIDYVKGWDHDALIAAAFEDIGFDEEAWARQQLGREEWEEQWPSNSGNTGI